ncbi:hypothetical protein NIBR502770_05910 [Pseudarthrobacter sp. NIBRBAC000502770]|nr:hypothetical protein NIBR502770_05910 [Pseudarthrobacter sp. NIBRBAC000502770]
MGKAWGILVVAAVTLTGCGTSADAVPVQTQKSAATTASTAASSKAEIGESICKDAAGDSKSSAVDLGQVRLLSDGSLVFVTFTTTANIPTSGTVLYSVTAWSPDGKTGYQLGAKFQNGKEVANFVYNVVTNKQENITNGAVAADKTVSTRYPLAKLVGLGDTFSWSGSVTVDGADVDRCADGEAKTPFPGV